MRTLALLALVLLAGCIETRDFIKTEDGYKLAYTYYEGGHNGVILIHELGGNKEEWQSLTRELERNEFSYLAIDLRGHGKSQGDWIYFDSDEFNEMIYDVKIAGTFLKERGVQIKGIVGASIGANLALKYAKLWDIDKLVLLSPGINYKGIIITNDMVNYTGDVRVIAAIDDSYSYTTSQMFQRDLNASFIKASGVAHGMDLLPEMNQYILEFLKQV